jgi:hypothetical protein
VTLKADRRRRLQTTLESYRLLFAALFEAGDAEAEILETVAEIEEDERALRALTDLADDPDAPRRAGITPDEFLRRRGIYLDPAVSITVEQAGSVHLSIRRARRYEIALDSDSSFAISPQQM